MDKLFDIGARIAFGLFIFAVLATAILMRPPKGLSDFDQAFYLSVAYDLNHHGVFSSGVVDDMDRTIATPPPGMFFGPLYPWLIVGVTKLDDRFARTVDCGVEAHHGKRPDTDCDIYVWPVHIIHALLLTLGVLAVARAPESEPRPPRRGRGRCTEHYARAGLMVSTLLPDRARSGG